MTRDSAEQKMNLEQNQYLDSISLRFFEFDLSIWFVRSTYEHFRKSIHFGFVFESVQRSFRYAQYSFDFVSH